MLRKPSRTPRNVAVVLAVVVLLLAGIWLGGHPSWMPASLRNTFVDNSNGQLVNQVLDLIQRNYYRPVNKTTLLNKGIGAAVASLDDPYSHYYDPSDYRAFLDQSNPHITGIGVDLSPSNSHGMRITSVFSGTPAAKAGLQPGDVIVAVGSNSLANRPFTFASKLIQGPAGTKVNLTIVRGTERRKVSIVRANVSVPVATSSIVKYHGTPIGDVDLTSFPQGAGAEVRTQVNRVLHKGARALILDLRQNGGGLLDEAVNVASIFIPDGTIVSTDGRSQPRQVYVAKGGAISTSIPMVVLVDRGTASAAEIVTGALQDRGRAKVVGTRTYGKGVFQEIQPLSNGGALDITVGEYFTPNGHNLGGGGVKEGAGIKPNVYAVDNPRTPADEALITAERTVAAELK